jgi:hypothetical protein
LGWGSGSLSKARKVTGLISQRINPHHRLFQSEKPRAGGKVRAFRTIFYAGYIIRYYVQMQESADISACLSRVLQLEDKRYENIFFKSRLSFVVDSKNKIS